MAQSVSPPRQDWVASIASSEASMVVSAFDNMQELVVPAGHFFVLGDNRDRSADSRVPAELAGVGMVPLTAIVGRPMYIHWNSDRAKIGTRLDR